MLAEKKRLKGDFPDVTQNKKKTQMRATILLALSAFLAACSTGVVSMGRGNYMVSEKAVGCGFATAGGQKADAYKKAKMFCSERDLNVEVISITSKDGAPFVQCASAELQFKCTQ